MKTELKRLYLSFVLGLAVVLGSCQSRSYPTSDFFAMDTYISVKADTASHEDLEMVRQYIESVENTFSRTKPSSDIFHINASDKAEVSAECAALLQRAVTAAKTTDGAFHPCLGELSELWDITGKKHVATDAEIAAALASCSYDSLEISGSTVSKKDSRTKIDLGAAVKGYAAEGALQWLKEHGVTNAMISLGGNISVCGNAENRKDGWVIGVRNPYQPDSLALTFSCTDRVIAVSGDYERYFEQDGIRYHHIFDSSTGKPARSGLRSTVVVAKDGFDADMLSTALFVMGAQKAARLYASGKYDFETILFTEDGTVLASEGIIDRLALTSDAKTETGKPLMLLPLSSVS